MMRYLMLSLFLGVAAPALATEYFVEKGGGDENPGTRMQPFRTISKAASLMEPGDICTVSRGLYRESIRPAKSGKAGAPLLFRAAAGETVSISGADEVTGWQSGPGGLNVAKTSQALQLLVDDQPGVRSSQMPVESVGRCAVWFWDEAGGSLYLKLAGSPVPEAHRIEIQTRIWGVDAGGLSHIELKGVNLIACSVNLAGSRLCRLEDCHSWWGGMRASLTNAVSGSTRDVPFLAAILLGGRDNEVVNCSIVGSIGHGLAFLEGGMNNCLINSLIRGQTPERVDNPAAGLLIQGTAPLIRHVTVMNHSAGALVCSNALNARIEDNDLHHAGAGSTNTSVVLVTGDGRGTVMSGNWIHDNAAPGGTGLRLQGPVENYVLRQNVIWGQPGAAIRMSAPCRFNFIFNNSCALNGCGLDAMETSVPEAYRETRVINNIFAGSVWPTSGGVPPAKLVWKNNYAGDHPGFVDETNRNFRLAAGSPCIDGGQEEPEFTDEFSGSLPDMGAYEFGREYAPPGCHVNESANKVITPVVKVIVESPTPGSELRYTLDGRNPDLSSSVYTGAVAVGFGAMVKVRAFRAGMEESDAAGMHLRQME